VSTKFIDITGRRFGALVVLYRVPRTSVVGHVIWMCQCDCGKQRVVRSQDLRRGSTKSCGCITRELRGRALGVGTKREATVRVLSGSYKLKCRKMAREWSLTADDVDALIFNDCHYCGRSPRNIARGRCLPHNGIDRVNNARGYHVDNVVTCCKACNLAKRTESVADFLAWAKDLALHQRF
jgi:hypothetical protein